MTRAARFARGRAESALRRGKYGPKFLCSVCGRGSQSLEHINACARRARKANP